MLRSLVGSEMCIRDRKKNRINIHRLLDSEARQQILLDQDHVSHCFLHLRQPVRAHPCFSAEDSTVGHVFCNQIHCLHHTPATDTNFKHQYNASAWQICEVNNSAQTLYVYCRIFLSNCGFSFCLQTTATIDIRPIANCMHIIHIRRFQQVFFSQSHGQDFQRSMHLQLVQNILNSTPIVLSANQAR